MKTVIVLSALAALGNGLSIHRPASSDQRSTLNPRSDVPEPGFFNLFSWLGPGTVGGNIMAWYLRDKYDMPQRYERLPSQYRAGSTRERLWYGPISLPSINDTNKPAGSGFLKMDPTSMQYNKRISGFCNECTVLSGKASLFFENGTKAGVDSGVYIHHIVTIDMAQRSSASGLPFYLCQEQTGFLGTFPAPAFLISGNDEAPNMFTTPDGSFNSGYHFTDSRWVSMQAELVNYRMEKQQVYVVIDYEYVRDDATSAPSKNVVEPAKSAVSLLSVTGCTPPDFHPTSRVYNVKSALVEMPRNGYIINAKGHLHDGGDYAVLKLNGKEICRSNAIYGKSTTDVNISAGHGHFVSSSSSPSSLSAAPAPAAPGDDGPVVSGPVVANGNATEWAVITEMTQCTEPVAVRKGDYLSMVAYIDGIKHPPRPLSSHAMEADEMGVFFINFAASNETAERLTLPGGKRQIPVSAKGVNLL